VLGEDQRAKPCAHRQTVGTALQSTGQNAPESDNPCDDTPAEHIQLTAAKARGCRSTLLRYGRGHATLRSLAEEFGRTGPTPPARRAHARLAPLTCANRRRRARSAWQCRAQRRHTAAAAERHGNSTHKRVAIEDAAAGVYAQ
jgi:hypothetical protein